MVTPVPYPVSILVHGVWANSITLCLPYNLITKAKEDSKAYRSISLTPGIREAYIPSYSVADNISELPDPYRQPTLMDRQR